MAKVDLRAGRFTPSRGLCEERVSHIEEYLSPKSVEWDWQLNILANRVSRLEERAKLLEARLDVIDGVTVTGGGAE